MATQVPTLGELLCVDELESKLNDLSEQVKLKKEEVRSNFYQLHSLLSLREEFLLREMDNIVQLARQEVADRKVTLQELFAAGDGLERDLAQNKLKKILEKNLHVLEAEIGEQVAKGVSVCWMELEWKREELEQSVIDVCRVISSKERPSIRNQFSTFRTKSLTQAKSVVEEWDRIETQIMDLEHEVQSGLNIYEQLKKEIRIVTDLRADIARNKYFTYIVHEDTRVKHNLASNTYVMNCLTCNFTCHNPCDIPDDGEKYDCTAMDRGGKRNAKCTVCSNRCSWEQHKSMRYYFTTERREVTKTSEGLKQRYLDANGKVKSATIIIEEMVDEFEAVQIKVVGITEVLRKSINTLNEIALKPNPLSTGEYIEILIESEKANAEPGFQERIAHLNEVKKKVESLAKLAGQGFDPFSDYKRKIKQEKDDKEGVWSAVGDYLKKINFF
eukprot:TRINITY_DN322_c0_g1_i4.p1 TRINITY_DN322_c0_g1~~TRINITY_DN322_c0_g1_i4.p1  ORF type:complete len:465 (-),score=82.49 TRINITY_DN322_c0_g1_i4:286-1617(-)